MSNTGPFRALRFAHPDFAIGAGRSGLLVGPTGALAMIEGDDSIRQSILLLLTTRPGERVMRPDYGCELYRLAFSPNDATTAGLAIHYVRRALTRWEPRIDLLHLDADPGHDGPDRLEIDLTYRVRRTGRDGRLVFPVDLNEA